MVWVACNIDKAHLWAVGREKVLSVVGGVIPHFNALCILNIVIHALHVDQLIVLFGVHLFNIHFMV